MAASTGAVTAVVVEATGLAVVVTVLALEELLAALEGGAVEVGAAEVLVAEAVVATLLEVVAAGVALVADIALVPEVTGSALATFVAAGSALPVSGFATELCSALAGWGVEAGFAFSVVPGATAGVLPAEPV